jgi:hypothetical protein
MLSGAAGLAKLESEARGGPKAWGVAGCRAAPAGESRI